KKSRGRRRRRSTSSSNSNGDSACSSGSSGGSIDSADSGHPFREGHRVKQLAKRIPGVLTRHAIDEMNRLLVQHLGEEDSSIIKPVLLRYIRLHVTVKNVPPAQKRELLTLGYTMDRLLQRDFLGAMDLIMQRVKAIEMVLGGASWAVAQNLELVPLEQEMITSVAEAQGAAREFRHEAKVQRDTGKGKGRWQEDWKTKKGDGKKGDGKSPKGGGKASQATRADPTKPN
ncbi:Tnks2, partial [Symbiodinium pilosum]